VGTSSRRGRQECIEGDPECDLDGEFNNTCTMRVVLCLNVPDPKVNGCAFVSAPGRVFRVELRAPALASDLGQKVGSGVLAAASDLARPAGSTARVNGSTVSYSPPITSFQCGRGTIRVPLRGTEGRARPGKVRVKVRSSDNSGRVRATGVLTFVCNP
jgi:hypothetical protein